jgi:hypothetical protein
MFEISPVYPLPLRRGRVRVAAGSESLWLGEGWTKTILPPPLHPLPPREGKVFVGVNVRDKFSDFNV